MILKILQKGLPSRSVLCSKAEEGDHSKTSVFKLFDLEGVQITLGKTGRIKNTARVARGVAIRELIVAEERILVLATGLLVILKATNLNKVEEEKLNHEKDLGVGKVLLGTSGSPVVASELSSEDASYSEHCPSSVLELGLYVPFESFGALGEVQGIETEVCCKN